MNLYKIAKLNQLKQNIYHYPLNYTKGIINYRVYISSLCTFLVSLFCILFLRKLGWKSPIFNQDKEERFKINITHEEEYIRKGILYLVDVLYCLITSLLRTQRESRKKMQILNNNHYPTHANFSSLACCFLYNLIFNLWISN